MSIVLLCAISSCSSDIKEKEEGLTAEKTSEKEVSEDNTTMDNVESSYAVDYFRTANITSKKLEEIETAFGYKYVFDGIIIQEDNGISSESANELLPVTISNGKR